MALIAQHKNISLFIINNILYSSHEVNLDILVARYTFKDVSKQKACDIFNLFYSLDNPIIDIDENSIGILPEQSLIVRVNDNYIYCIPDCQLN